MTTRDDGEAPGTGLDLPWTRTRSRAPRGRGPLTREQIVEAAIRLIDAEGLDALSMRRLGAELDAGATSLYWHVRNKSELLDLVLDELLAEVGRERGDATGWRDQLTDLARALRRVLLRHPGAAPLIGERPTIGPNALDLAESVIAIMREAGLGPRDALLGSNLVVDFAAGTTTFELRTWLHQRPDAEAYRSAVVAYLGSLPAERYPTIVALAGEQIEPGEAFEFGLARVLDGLELLLARSASGGH